MPADRYLNQFLARGTAAQRAAFTPSPPAPAVGPVHAYLWWDTDTAQVYAWDGATWEAISAPPRTGALGIIIDGGGSVITTGVKGFLAVPFPCTITGVTLLSSDAAATSGSIVVDIWKDTYANYPPTVADTITASAKPTLSSANKSTDSTLTGWTTTITAGDVLGFNVDSATTVTKVALSLTVVAT